MQIKAMLPKGLPLMNHHEYNIANNPTLIFQQSKPKPLASLWNLEFYLMLSSYAHPPPKLLFMQVL